MVNQLSRIDNSGAMKPEMREGKIYPTSVLEGGFSFGKHMNLQWVCGQSLSAFPYPQTTSSQGWIPREILTAP